MPNVTGGWGRLSESSFWGRWNEYHLWEKWAIWVSCVSDELYNIVTSSQLNCLGSSMCLTAWKELFWFQFHGPPKTYPTTNFEMIMQSKANHDNKLSRLQCNFPYFLAAVFSKGMVGYNLAVLWWLNRSRSTQSFGGDDVSCLICLYLFIFGGRRRTDSNSVSVNVYRLAPPGGSRY